MAGCSPIIEFVAFSNGRLRIRHDLDLRELRVMGDLDCVTLHVLVGALASITGGGGVCVDLAHLEFIDVGALRVLVNVAAQRDDGHVLTLRSAPPQVCRLLNLTGWGEAPRLRLQAATDPLAAVLFPRPGQSVAPTELPSPA
ncbi:STAS domain-containing protein [Nonomuraea sp. NPDC049141]|uniref:STAS domain-containing protein n=1 Tax=Nonomuraea sp. NPDC049141 TaxID=3155500 RepID=UPI0034054B90